MLQIVWVIDGGQRTYYELLVWEMNYIATQIFVKAIGDGNLWPYSADPQ